jgi:hypothetical protein
MNFVSTKELESKLAYILESPKEEGILKMIVRRPDIDQREVIEQGELSISDGLIGDSWKLRGSSKTPDRTAHPEMQINIMNVRIIELIAKSEKYWSLAGDQLYVDLDLSERNCPPGTHIAIGETVLEITKIPHRGCKKFMSRFGMDALKFVNSAFGEAHHFRGLNAKILKEGVIKKGDSVIKLN